MNRCAAHITAVITYYSKVETLGTLPQTVREDFSVLKFFQYWKVQRAVQQCERGSHERGGSATHVRTTRVEGASRPMVVDSLNDVVAMMKQLRNSAHVDDYEEDYDMPGKNLPAALPAVAVTDASVSSEALAAAPGPATFLALSTC